MAQMIEHCDPPGEVFRAVVENASRLQQNGIIPGDLVDELCSDEALAHVSITHNDSLSITNNTLRTNGYKRIGINRYNKLICHYVIQ